MTIREAELFLNIPENSVETYEDDLIDTIESSLFEQKAFFLAKVPIQKMFESRLKKLLVLKEALDLIKYNFKYEFEEKEIHFKKGDFVLEIFQNYNIQKQKLKFGILNSQNPLEIHFLVLQKIKLEKCYAENWFEDSCWEESTLVSKELDPMEILKAIKEFEISNGKTFEDLKKMRNNPPEILISEMKRLSLLFKMY